MTRSPDPHEGTGSPNSGPGEGRDQWNEYSESDRRAERGRHDPHGSPGELDERAGLEHDHPAVEHPHPRGSRAPLEHDTDNPPHEGTDSPKSGAEVGSDIPSHEDAGSPSEESSTSFVGHQIGTREYRRISISLFLAGLATFALLYDTQPILPLIGDEFGLRADEAALSVSVTTLGLALALLVAGPVSEVRGRTRIMFASLFVSAIVAVLVGLAPTWQILLFLRFVQGITVAGLPAVAMAYLSEEVHGSAQARAAGLYIGGTALGGMSGRLGVGALTEFLGWRGALVGMGVMAFACALAVWKWLPRSRGFVPGQAGLKNLWHQTAAIMRDPVLVGLFFIAAASMGSFVGVFNIMGYRLEEPPYSLSVGVSGLVFLVYALGSYASAFAGRAASKVGQRKVEPVAVTVMLIGLLITLLHPLWLVIVGLAIFTVGFFAVHGVASGWVAARAKAGVGATGQASSGYMFFYYTGSSIFGALAGTFWAWAAWPGVVLMAGVMLALVLVTSLLLKRTRSLGAR
ncbi:MAG: MFS transporter [Actinomycetaceae bacterium]|nr:MFS transporter [Actinomycetaceae bacterium]